MLSHTTISAFINRLRGADARTRGWGHPPELILLQDRPYAGDRRRRQTRAVPFTIHPQVVADHPTGIPGVLDTVAAALTGHPQPHSHTTGHLRRIDVGAITTVLTGAPPGVRLLGWAVGYDDLLADPDGVGRIHRVDAVDIDGRVYQLTRLPGPEQPAVVAVDGEPHPDDTPATHPGLTALITATRHLIHTVYRRPRP